MVSPCFVGVQAAIGPNLRFGEPMCVPAVLVFGFQTTSKAACTLKFRVAPSALTSRPQSSLAVVPQFLPPFPKTTFVRLPTNPTKPFG